MKTLRTIIALLLFTNTAIGYSQKEPQDSSEAKKKCDCIPSRIKTKECFDYCKNLEVVEKSVRDFKKDIDKEKSFEEKDVNSWKLAREVKDYFESNEWAPEKPVQFDIKEEKVLGRLQNKSMD